jgi:hypothetical protein
MELSTDTIRRMIMDAYGAYLSPQEIEQLLPYVQRHFETMKQLHALDLGAGDPRTLHYIEDRRLSR